MSAQPPPSNAQDGPKRKRRRKIWSCTECRRRKLQCDRTLPACTRCTTTGQSAQCSYVDDVPGAESPNFVLNGRFRNPASPATSAAKHVSKPQRSGQSATGQSTTSLRAATTKLPPTPESVFDAGNNRVVSAKIEEMIHLDGSSFRTKFNGNTHASSSINLISGLSAFSKEIRDSNPAVDAVRQEIHLSQVQKILVKQQPQSEGSLRSLLPPRARVDQLLQLYLESYGNVYHVLHLPDFQKDYDELWSNFYEAKPQFVVLLLLITAVALCLTAMDSPTPSSPSGRDEALTIIQACETWLNGRIRKLSTMIDFQIAFLLLLARQLNGRRFKATWANAGKVMRDFICAGFHRDPETLKDTAAHEKDVRRRLWFSIAEFELQAAFEQGLPAMPWPQQSDIVPTKDDVFDEEEFAPSSYLIVASDSLLFRHELNSLLNNLYRPLSFDESKLLTEKIESLLTDIPSWSNAKAGPLQALLSVTLLQYMLALHERQVRESTTPFEKNTSRSILLTTAMKMIDIHKDVRDNGSRLIDLFCDDHIRAALSLCYVYSTLDPDADYLLIKATVPHAMESMELVITIMSEKALRYEYDHRQLWIIIVANAFLKSKEEPNQRQQLMQNAADEFTDLHHKIFAIHKTANGNRTRNEVPIAPKGTEHLDSIDAPPNSAIVPQHDPTLPALEGVGNWGFEDWMFEDWPFETETLNGWTANAGPMVLS